MGVYADVGLHFFLFLGDFWICFGILGNYWDFYFSDSSRFSASVPPIFTPKYALGADFGPEQNFEKSRFLDPHRRGPPSAPF